MPTKNPRINVTFGEEEAEILDLIAKSKKTSMSAIVRKVVEDWLEDYEDMLWSRRAEEKLKDWEKKGRKTISEEEMWKRLNIK